MEQIDRAVRILKNPQDELNKVKSEKTSKNYIIKHYIAILVMIPAIAYIIGMGIVGNIMGFFGGFEIPIQTVVVVGILTYVLTITGIYVSGIAINTLAPNFASKQNENQAMKLAAYVYTPVLLGGGFDIVPNLSVIGLLLSLYGLYILYLGVPILMETPQDKALNYTIVLIVAMLVIYAITKAIIYGITISMIPPQEMMGFYI